MRGYLFDDITVEIDERSVALGGSWQGAPRDGLPTAWDADLLRFFFGKMTPGCRFLDIGANTGSYCLLLVLDPASTCVVFEPYPKAYHVLLENLAMNGIDNRVNVASFGLWDKYMTGNLAIPGDGASGLACLADSPTRFTPAKRMAVALRRLDDIEVGHVDLAKIDVEGAELMVLRGASETLLRDHPGLLVEYDERNTAAFGYDRREIIDYLKTLDYTSFEYLGPDGRDVWAT